MRNEKELLARIEQLEYILMGVMHFVDKWLDDDVPPYHKVIDEDKDGSIAVNRAAEARKVALKAIEEVKHTYA